MAMNPQHVARLLYPVCLAGIVAWRGATLAWRATVVAWWALAGRALARARTTGKQPGGGSPPLLVCFSHVMWNHVWQRNQHVMSAMACRRRVVYFQQTYMHAFASGLAQEAARGRAGEQLFPRDTRGVQVRQLLLLPGESRMRLLAWLNARIMWLEVRYAQIGAGDVPFILWFYYPGGVGVVPLVKPEVVVYDIQDEYAAFPWAPRDIARREERMLELADVVFPGTWALHQARPHPNRHFFACGVEFDHFHAVAATDARQRLTPPQALPPAPEGTRRLFFAGLIDRRIDPELLRFLGKARPHWHIIMVGPVDLCQFAEGDFPPNVIFPGKQPYGELPRWMAHSDVLIMPWAVNDLTRHINPTKTLEYLASRRPVVSTSLPDLETFYADVCLLASNHQEFLEHCDRALANPDEKRLELGVERARGASWASVVDAMEGHIQDAIAARKNAPTPPRVRAARRANAATGCLMLMLAVVSLLAGCGPTYRATGFHRSYDGLTFVGGNSDLAYAIDRPAAPGETTAGFYLPEVVVRGDVLPRHPELREEIAEALQGRTFHWLMERYRDRGIQVSGKMPDTANLALTGRQAHEIELAITEVKRGNGVARWVFGAFLGATVFQVEGTLRTLPEREIVARFVCRVVFSGNSYGGLNPKALFLRYCMRVSADWAARDISELPGIVFEFLKPLDESGAEPAESPSQPRAVSPATSSRP